MRGLTLIYFCNALSQHWLLCFLHTLEVMDTKRKRNRRFNSTKSKRKGVFLNRVRKKWKTLGKSGEKERDSAGWRDGRIVEIGFSADQLTEGCSECKTK